MKKFGILVCWIVITLFYGITSLSAAQNLPDERSLGSKLTTEEGMILLTMENLVMTNEYWGQADGWYHEIRQTQPDGPEGFYFSDTDHWFELKDRKLINSLMTITDTEGNIAQRWIITDQTRAELELLSEITDESYDYAKPMTVDAEMLRMVYPPVLSDFEEIKLRNPFIDSILMTETSADDLNLVQIRVEHTHHGNPFLQAHGVPAGKAIGMVNIYTYDASSGNRLRWEMAYLNHDLTYGTPHVSIEKTEFVGELPAEMKAVWEQSIAELKEFQEKYPE
jgi:hypothetical protein